VVLELAINTRKPFFLSKKEKSSFLMQLSAQTNVRIHIPDLTKELEISRDPKDHVHSLSCMMTLEGCFEGVRKYCHFYLSF
jgi:hypothetical protein